MAKGTDTGIKRIILRIVRENQDRFKDGFGDIDKEAMTAFVLDELERVDPEFLEMLEREGARQFIWEAIREMHRGTRKGMKAEIEEAIAEAMQPRLPSFEEVEKITLSVPVGSTDHRAKDLPDCALWEVDATADDYGKRGHALLQHGRFLENVSHYMNLAGCGQTDTVRDFYRKIAG